LSEKSRSALYLGLRNIVDEEALQEMLSHFPARDLDEPVTNDGLRASMADLRAELKGEMAEIRAEMAALRAELKSDITDLRSEMTDLRAELKGDMAALEQRLIDRMNRMQRWNIVTMIALAAVVVAAIRI
nr:hypothetical protein [Microthrixaceae bacterium]